jgi:hypothetical protein
MPGDSNACREQARDCLRLAHTARTAAARETFSNLAATWLSLARELEQSILGSFNADDHMCSRAGPRIRRRGLKARLVRQPDNTPTRRHVSGRCQKDWIIAVLA